MKKPTTRITTHDHAPAPYHTLDMLALSRAADCDDTDNATQAWRNEQLDDMRSDLNKILLIIEDQQKQKQLDAEMTQIKLINAQYSLGKARAERTAAVLLLVAFVAVTLGVLV